MSLSNCLYTLLYNFNDLVEKKDPLMPKFKELSWEKTTFLLIPGTLEERGKAPVLLFGDEHVIFV